MQGNLDFFWQKQMEVKIFLLEGVGILHAWSNANELPLWPACSSGLA